MNEIDLLRFIAALAVVFYHYAFRGYAADAMSPMPYPLLAAPCKYGYLGVELFFMISGFVILMTASSGSFHKFVVSRVVRLYPDFWACCTITFLVTIWIGEPRYSVTVSQYLANMTMLGGFFGVPSIDGVYWSLFVEMKFYAWVGLVVIARRIDKAQSILFLWLLASILLELVPIVKLRSLLIVDFSAYFIAGASFYLLWLHGPSRARFVLLVMSWGLALYESLRTLPTFEKHYNTSMSVFVVAGIVTCFFVTMLIVSLKGTGALRHRRWIVLGAMTYPLYLLHANIGFMIFSGAYPAINPHLLFWGTIAAVLLAAFAVHRLVEKPLSIALKNLVATMTVKVTDLKLGI